MARINSYNRNLSPAAADMVGGNYSPMNSSEYNFKPKKSPKVNIKQVPESKLGNNKADVIHNRGARATAARDAAISQQNKMDVARDAGQITDREVVKQNKILNARRSLADTYTKTPSGQFVKAANPKIMSTNPSGAGAKASTLGGRSWMWNIGTKTK